MVTQDINTDIRFFKPNDPYYYEVDNLPLLDLLKNDVILRDEINLILDVSINHASISYVDDEIQLAVGDDTKVDINIPPNAGSAPFGNIIEWVEAQVYGSNQLWGLTDVHSGINNNYDRRDETYLRYNSGDQKYYHDSTKEIMGQGYFQDIANVYPNWQGNWVSGEVMSVQLDVTVPGGVKFRAVAMTTSVNELDDLEDMDLGGKLGRAEGDIAIWNNSTDEFKRANTRFKTHYTDHPVINEYGGSMKLMHSGPTYSTGTTVGWKTFEVSIPWLSNNADEVAYVTALFQCYSENNLNNHIHWRRAYGFTEVNYASSYGADGAGLDGTCFVTAEIPVIDNGGYGKFKADIKIIRGDSANIARIYIIGAKTEDQLTRVIGNTLP